jgi:dihydrofolate reductase
MSMVTTDLMISLDGCIGGAGAERLHEWIANLASWRERQGMAGGEENEDSALIRAWFEATGAVVMGRTMFEEGEAFWGDDPPFRAPVFVLTHRPRPFVEKQGGSSYTFVTDGIASALAQATAAAGDRNVNIAGGAATVQQYLRAGLIDELSLHLVPVLFGQGLRLFDGLPARQVELEPVHVSPGPQATHLRYRVRR